MKRTFSGAILAGGKSRRMGFNKAFIALEGSTVVARAARTMAALFPEPVIIANDPALYSHLGLPVFPDIIKNAGSLGGIYTALYHSSKDYVFITACDMPWLDPGCVRRVLDNVDGEDCVIPFINGRDHPMHAAWSKGCLSRIETMINEGNLRINDLLKRLRIKRLTEECFHGLPIERSVENVNTPEDLERTGLDGKNGQL
jgi:molybdopterin-guanine dinucleotide biosynthesis protein A